MPAIFWSRDCDTDDVDDRYWFDNSLSDEGNRLRLLEAIADPRSIRLLSDLDVEQGWRCAELGAGGGSIAMWLADQVGDRGSVMTGDRNVALLGHLNERSNINIVEASIESLRLPPGTLVNLPFPAVPGCPFRILYRSRTGPRAQAWREFTRLAGQ